MPQLYDVSQLEIFAVVIFDAADAENIGSVSVYDVKYPLEVTYVSEAYDERSGGVNVNSPLPLLYVRAAVPADAVVTVSYTHLRAHET